MTTFKQHHELTLTDLHGTIWQSVADQAARTALSVTAADVGKDVHQQDDDSVHKLVDVSPSVWKDITGTGGGGTWFEDVYTPTAGQVTFILSQTPSQPVTIIMDVNGVGAQETLDYTISGSTLTWLNTSFSMETTDDVVVQYK